MKSSGFTVENTFPRHIILWGAGGHTGVVRSVLREKGVDATCVVDDSLDAEQLFPDVPMLRGRQAFEEWLLSINTANAGFIITFGPPYGLGKFQTAQYLEGLGLDPITLISPHAIVDETARIAPGVQILRGAIVQCYANIEPHVIVNTGAVVEHDSHIGACTFLGPRSVICGRVHVGCHSTIGANATVITDMSIGDNTIVGAGAVVVKDTPSNVVVAGVPARYLRSNSIEKPAKSMVQDSEINAVKNL